MTVSSAFSNMTNLCPAAGRSASAGHVSLLNHAHHAHSLRAAFSGRQLVNKTGIPRQQQRVSVTAGLADVAGVLILSAIPFAAVQALADSDLGSKLQEDLEADKPRLQREQQQYAQQAAQARADSRWYGPEAPRWLGPLPYDYPDWLPADAPANYRFDIAALSLPEGKFDRYFELELLHARWAMLGALGALLPEVLQYTGVTEFLTPVWWKVGAVKAFSGEDLNYLGVAGFRVAGGQGIAIIAICQILLMGGPEYARYCGIDALEPLGVFLPGDKNYPGGWLFDPFGFADDPAKTEDLKVKELKNGRLAMIAWAGFFVQGAVTKAGPLQNAIDFWRDPAGHNIFPELQHFQGKQVFDLNV